MIDMEQNIIIFPEFEQLKKEVAKLKTEISMLLLEHDELKYVICRNIETAYMLKLGALEYKAYEAQCIALRLKRKIELIQARLNRMEKANLSEIEAILDAEFEDFQRKLDEQIDKMNEALDYASGKPLSDEEMKELKKLYRKIVKLLHPDLNPNITPAQAELFEKAVTAYKDGNLQQLRVIADMINDEIDIEDENAILKLSAEKKRLEASLNKIKENIIKIKSEYPYTLKEITEDDEATEKYKTQLEDILSQYNELIEFYNLKLKEMLR